MEQLSAILDISLEAASRFYAWGWGISVTGGSPVCLSPNAISINSKCFVSIR